MSKTSTRRFVNTNEAAEYFSVHPNTIRNWLSKGLIKGHRTPGGRLYMFDLNELEAAFDPSQNA